MIMSNDLGTSQGNAKTEEACEVTTNPSDRDALLNLNGKVLEYNFNNNSGKSWTIFHINDASVFTLTNGSDEGQGILKMSVSEIKSGNIAKVFLLDAGSTLIIKKGVTVEFSYSTKAQGSAMMFDIAGMTQEELLESYSDKILYDETTANGMKVMRLTVLDTVVIEASSAANYTNLMPLNSPRGVGRHKKVQRILCR